MSISWPGLATESVVVQNVYLKMQPLSCINTHHDVIDLVNYGMVENTKT